MKTIMLIAFLSYCYRTLGEGTNRVTIKYPSALQSTSDHGTSSYGVDFVLRPISDFRLMYCDDHTLGVRIESKVCIIDFALQNGKQHEEIKLSSNMSLTDVLRKSRFQQLQGWRGGQPGIRIVRRRSIVANDGTEAFGETKISPGDFIIVMPVD
jgi:hypothetical protein